MKTAKIKVGRFRNQTLQIMDYKRVKPLDGNEVEVYLLSNGLPYFASELEFSDKQTNEPTINDIFSRHYWK